jgi:hypothetical protein
MPGRTGGKKMTGGVGGERSFGEIWIDEKRESPSVVPEGTPRV